MKARIITIGDEILIGQIVDTNSAWLAKELHQLGIGIERIESIADTRESIHKALNEVGRDIALVILTGGLGPTKDDITKASLGEWFESGWRTDDMVLERVSEHFAMRGIPMPEVNRGQAEVPDNCEVLFNAFGSAPGMWFEKNGTVFISMPGVPFEMKSIFTDQAIPLIQARLQKAPMVHKTIMTQGIGESSLMEIISDWEQHLRASGLKLAYLPSVGSVRLRVSGTGTNQAALERQIEEEVKKVLPLIVEFAYGFDDEALEVTVGRLLKDHGMHLATAESCTGGYVSHLITSVPGSSAYYNGSAITYSNEAKTEVLDVSPELLIEHGAVSEAVAKRMAERARTLYHSDFAISTTGIAGPDGGSEEKPVGTVWIGVAGPSGVFAEKFQMGNHRERNIRKAALQGLQLVRKEILKEIGISLLEALD
ncbi:MAG: competence/damage-inducible protein A [Cryomorphaceae bacterium]